MGLNEFLESICRPQGPPLGPPGEMGALRLYFGASRAPFGVSKVMKNHPEMVSEEPKNEARK